MGVDPADGCTFYYTQQYIPANGAFNWKTRIGSFKFPSCSGTVANDFSLGASPTSLNLAQGAGNGTSTISTALTSGSAETVSLSVTGVPPGATASLSPTSVTAGGSSTLTVNAGTAAAGSYTVTVTGTAASATHSTTISLTVTAPPPANDFSFGASPTSLNLAHGGANGTSTISTAVTSGSAETVSLSVTGVPPGATASLSPTSVTAGGSSTLTVNAGTAAAGSYTVTVTGTAASATHSTTISVTVSAAPPPSGITDGGFETGTLSGWTSAGSTSVANSGCHGGTYCARAGSTSPTNGDSSVAQTFTASTGTSTLSFFYKMTCPDTVTYDWATATLKDNTAGTTATMLAKTCTTNAWTKVSGSVTAGHSYTLTLISHDDNYGADPSYTLFDDVTTQ